MSEAKWRALCELADSGASNVSDIARYAKEHIESLERELKAQSMELSRAYADRDENARERDEARRRAEMQERGPFPWEAATEETDR